MMSSCRSEKAAGLARTWAEPASQGGQDIHLKAGPLCPEGE